MNLLLLVVLLIILFTSQFVIIPKFAPPDQQEMINNWMQLAFPALLIIIVVAETRFGNPNIIYPIMLYLILLTFILSGVFWWIPAYIPADKQNEAIKYIFLSTSVAISLSNVLTPPPLILGGRRR